VLDEDVPTSEDVVVNWDGEVIDDSWFSREAFTIGNTVITNKEVTQVSGITIVIIVIIVVVCMVVSFRKRKRIAMEARRASEFVRRSTRKLRMSIKKTLGQPID
jgi:ATP/ADP translocase